MVVGFGRVGPECQNPIIAGQRLAELALLLQRVAQVDMRLGEIRLQSECLLKPGQGLVGQILISKDGAQVVVGLGEIGPKSQRLPVVDRRFVEFALVLEHVAQVVVCLGNLRRQSERLLEPSHGLVEFALAPEDVAQVIVCLEEARFKSRGLLILGCRFVQSALLDEHVAQVVVDLGGVGPQRERLAIGRGSLGQPPGTMFALCQGEQRIKFAGPSGRWAGRGHRCLSSLAAGDSDPGCRYSRQPSSSINSGSRYAS